MSTSTESIRRGFQTLTPYLVAQDAAGLIELTKEVFGGEEISRAIGPSGGIHCEIRLGDSTLMIGGGGSGLTWHGPSFPNALHVYVENTDVTYQRALGAGAVSIDEPANQSYGERSASVKDPAGNNWYIATREGERYVPADMRRVTPCLHPLRAAPLIDFLERAFGARELERYASPDGAIHHAKLQLGDSVLEMGEAHGPYQPMPAMFLITVPDVDASYRRAIDSGATPLSEPADQPYGARSGGVKDPFGNMWYVSMPLRKAVP